MIELAKCILTNFIDYAVQCAANPPDGAELFGIIGTAVDDVLCVKERLHFSKADASRPDSL